MQAWLRGEGTKRRRGIWGKEYGMRSMSQYGEKCLEHEVNIVCVFVFVCECMYACMCVCVGATECVCVRRDPNDRIASSSPQRTRVRIDS